MWVTCMVQTQCLIVVININKLKIASERVRLRDGDSSFVAD